MTDKENITSQSNRLPPEWDAEDAAISIAMHRISVPAQAIARVRAQLRAAAAEQPTSPSIVSAAAVEHHLDDAPIELVESQFIDPRVQRPMVRRRLIVAVVAMAASLAFLLFYVRSRPLTENQLASHCVEQLEVVVAQLPQWQAVRDDAALKLEPLMRNLNRRLTLVGAKPHSPGSVANSCTLWKLDTGSGKFLYVFDFEDSRRIGDIPSRFRVIKQSSSSWSLAALQQGGRVLVVAIEGDITEYIKTLEYA